MTVSYLLLTQLLLPGIVLAAAGLIVALVEAFFPRTLADIPSRVVIVGITLIGWIIAGLVAAMYWWQGTVANGFGSLSDPSNMLVFDPYTAALTLVFCIGGIGSTLLAARHLEASRGAGEYCSLMLFAGSGAYLMAASQHLIMVFIGLEILSVAIYPLAGFARRDPRSNEAALKYFLLGAFSSSFILYGVALIYGAVGMGPSGAPGMPLLPGSSGLMSAVRLLSFPVLAHYALMMGVGAHLFWVGSALLLCGFCFKAALAPFHMWAPDVYDGSPTPVSAFMASVVKAAAFAPFFRFFLDVLGRSEASNTLSYDHWATALAVISVVTMFWGNLSAVVEPSMKRMLAFSSVAHAGYITIALVAANRSSMVFYLLVYSLMVIGSFGCAGLIRRAEGGEALQIEEWAGVGLRHPWLGGAMTLFLFSLAGFPPTAGFMGKLVVFRAALDTGMYGQNHTYLVLVIIALINSLISVYYYLRVVLVMYRQPPRSSEEVYCASDFPAGLAIAICAMGVILLGLFPQPLMNLLRSVG